MAILLFTFAVPEEARPFRRLLPLHATVHSLVTGIGPRNATAALTAHLPRLQPSAVISCGFAGGLNPALPLAQVVADLTDAGNLRPLLERLQLPHTRFLTSPRVISRAADKRALFASSGADAVEMESGPIRDLCRQRGLPCAIIRVISDTAHEDLPLDFNQFLDSGDKLVLTRILGTLAAAPGRIPALLRFQRQTRLAAQRLADVLAHIVRTT